MQKKMKKNKVLKTLIVTLSLLFLGIFFKIKTAEAIQFNIYDPQNHNYYQVQVNQPSLFPLSIKSELSKATGLPKSLFLIDDSDLFDDRGHAKESYDLELPIDQVIKDGVLYNIYRNNEVVVAGVADDKLENVVIASEINQQKVTRIGAFAFYNCGRIRSVTFEPNSEIISIGSNCFYRCRSLANITLPNSITNIGSNCFEYCTSLANINLPDSLVSLSYLCFSKCQSLTNITLPSSLKSIGEECFNDCTALKDVNLPDSLTSIGHGCFYSCHSLTNINLPDAITSIDGCFIGCDSLANITLPSSLKSIGDYCFCHCSLKDITLPSSLQSIGDNAFSSCANLHKINLGTDSKLQDLGQDIFKNTKIDDQMFRFLLNAIHRFQNAEERRSDQLASVINLTDQKYQEELHNIYSLFNRHCSTDDLISAYDALTRKVGLSAGEDHPDFIKLKQGKKCYAESLSKIEQERASEISRIERYNINKLTSGVGKINDATYKFKKLYPKFWYPKY